MSAFARLTDFRFQIYDDHKGKQQQKTPPQNKQTTLAHLSTGTVVTASALALSLV